MQSGLARRPSLALEVYWKAPESRNGGRISWPNQDLIHESEFPCPIFEIPIRTHPIDPLLPASEAFHFNSVPNLRVGHLMPPGFTALLAHKLQSGGGLK